MTSPAAQGRVIDDGVDDLTLFWHGGAEIAAMDVDRTHVHSTWRHEHVPLVDTPIMFELREGIHDLAQPILNVKIRSSRSDSSDMPSHQESWLPTEMRIATLHICRAAAIEIAVANLAAPWSPSHLPRLVRRHFHRIGVTVEHESRLTRTAVNYGRQIGPARRSDHKSILSKQPMRFKFPANQCWQLSSSPGSSGIPRPGLNGFVRHILLQELEQTRSPAGSSFSKTWRLICAVAEISPATIASL